MDTAQPWVGQPPPTGRPTIAKTLQPLRPTTSEPLANRTLHRHAGRVRVPTYDRAALVPSVVHVGVGGFHRAHQAVYFDDLAQERVSSDWGVLGVGLRSAGTGAALAPQDCLYTVTERGADEDRVRVVGAINAYLFGPDDPDAVLRVLARPRTRLVTLTITGDGYVAEPRRPGTVWAYLAAALDLRRRAGLAPFTVLSCDNLPGNGAAARSALLAVARARDDRLAGWIEANVAFPRSMVDRITPATTASARLDLAREYGVRDRCPVTTEAFSQWIVEDTFCNDRPPLEEVGVQFVADVRPYEVVKKRLLNGSHCALAYLGRLAGHATTAEVMDDPVLRRYVTRLMADEVAPLLPPAAGLDLGDYRRTVEARLANPRIGDPLARLCARGSTKLPAYLLPSLAEARAAGRPHELLTLALAGWLRYLRGTDHRGRALDIVDAHAPRLRRLALAGGDDPRPLLRRAGVFGSLAVDEGFAEDLARALRRISQHGAREAIVATLAGHVAQAA